MRNPTDDDAPVRDDRDKDKEKGPRSGKAIPRGGWKFRFDTPPRPDDSKRADSGDILSLFRAWEAAESADRRANRRYAPAAALAWVGWWKHGSFRVANAEILNLSHGGALVHLDTCPPTCQPVWVCLGTPHPIDFVQARVLDPKGEGEVTFMARIAFHTPCPPSFFLAAGFLGERAEGESE